MSPAAINLTLQRKIPREDCVLWYWGRSLEFVSINVTTIQTARRDGFVVAMSVEATPAGCLWIPQVHSNKASIAKHVTCVKFTWSDSASFFRGMNSTIDSICAEIQMPMNNGFCPMNTRSLQHPASGQRVCVPVPTPGSCVQTLSVNSSLS